MIVRLSASSSNARFTSRLGEVLVVHADGCEVSAFCAVDSAGVCVPEAVVEVGFEAGRDGFRDGIVWLSCVKRKEVMITCGT